MLEKRKKMNRKPIPYSLLNHKYMSDSHNTKRYAAGLYSAGTREPAVVTTSMVTYSIPGVNTGNYVGSAGVLR